MKEDNNELIIINEENIKDLIYEIRGQKVMLDFDLARIYGYETKRFNEQVKNNKDKFPEDFMFQISKEESELLVMSKISTARIWNTGNTGGRTSPPYAFTEKGIYMLMTVLRGELAIKQSIALIRLFQAMKDYLTQSNNCLLTNTNSYLESRLNVQDRRIDVIESKIDVFMDGFNDKNFFIIYNGERLKADIFFQDIYKTAKQSIIIVDDYIDIKTIEHLLVCSKDISITLISDNVARKPLSEKEIEDFITDSGINLYVKPTNNIIHDRYIVIDYKTDNESLFICGPSSKDAGNRIGSIIKTQHPELYHQIIDLLLKNSDKK